MGWKERLGIGAGVLVVVASLAWVRLVYLPEQSPSKASFEAVKLLVGKEFSRKFWGFTTPSRVEAVTYDPLSGTIFVAFFSLYSLGLRTEADVHHFCALFGVSAGWSGELSELYRVGL